MTEKVGEARRLLRETGANVESNVVFTLKEWTEIDKQAAQLEERVRELEEGLGIILHMPLSSHIRYAVKQAEYTLEGKS